MAKEFRRFKDFYPFYLAEHSNPNCRRLHFAGSTGVLAALLYALAASNPWVLLSLPVVGYGFAWAGHFFFERNRPATFRHPWYSLMGDWVMYRDIVTGRLPL